jgi:hypothetical protein
LTKLYDETVAFESKLKKGVYEPAEKEVFDAIADKTRAYLKILLAAIACYRRSAMRSFRDKSRMTGKRRKFLWKPM